MGLADHVLRMREVLCWQPFALFCQVSFVPHAIAQGTIPVLALMDFLKLVHFLTVYLNRRQGFGHRIPVVYVELQQQDVEDIVNTASLLQMLQVVGLRAYLLHDLVRFIESMVELLLRCFIQMFLPDNQTMSPTSNTRGFVRLLAYFC